jgi:diketogulonate reductase-like aldo/keto reductase
MTLATRRLGRTGHQSSVAILGGAMFGRTDPDTTAEAFQLALDAGVNHVDIAPSYGNAEIVAEIQNIVFDVLDCFEKPPPARTPAWWPTSCR